MFGFGTKAKLVVCGKLFCFKYRTFQCVQTQCCCELPCGMATHEWTLVINLDQLNTYFVNNYETSNTFQYFSVLHISFIFIQGWPVEGKLHSAHFLPFTKHMAHSSTHNETQNKHNTPFIFIPRLHYSNMYLITIAPSFIINMLSRISKVKKY